jgi:hypothetical protein
MKDNNEVRLPLLIAIGSRLVPEMLTNALQFYAYQADWLLNLVSVPRSTPPQDCADPLPNLTRSIRPISRFPLQLRYDRSNVVCVEHVHNTFRCC